MAAPDTRTVGRLPGGSASVGSEGGAGVGVGVIGLAVMVPTAVLGFGCGVAGVKAIGFRSPVVGGVVVFGQGAAGIGAALGLMFVACCRVVLVALVNLVRSWCCPLLNVLAAARVRCWGTGCRSVLCPGGEFLHLASSGWLLASNRLSMAFITQL